MSAGSQNTGSYVKNYSTTSKFPQICFKLIGNTSNYLHSID